MFILALYFIIWTISEFNKIFIWYFSIEGTFTVNSFKYVNGKEKKNLKLVLNIKIELFDVLLFIHY